MSLPLGPVGVSLDYTTETPVADAIGMAIPGAGLVNSGMEMLGLEEYSPANLIQRGAESLWDWAVGE